MVTESTIAYFSPETGVPVGKKKEKASQINLVKQV